MYDAKLTQEPEKPLRIFALRDALRRTTEQCKSCLQLGDHVDAVFEPRPQDETNDVVFGTLSHLVQCFGEFRHPEATPQRATERTRIGNERRITGTPRRLGETSPRQRGDEDSFVAQATNDRASVKASRKSRCTGSVDEIIRLNKPDSVLYKDLALYYISTISDLLSLEYLNRKGLSQFRRGLFR